MINLIETPQRSDSFRAEYIINNDILTVILSVHGQEYVETYDFNGFEEGIAEEIIAEELPVNPVVTAEKIGDVINVTVIRFYGEDEKHLFEKNTYLR